ncbi:MAG: hypothetical protein FWF54_08200 [Candidatus Azobacteroides sp.]|nr:hypothetical protein [Candidatus Azobacteroides sp.]
MKKHLRTILLLSVVVATTLTQYSCSGLFGIDITDQKDIDDNLRSKIEKFVGSDAKIIEISLGTEGTGENFSKTVTSAQVYYFESGSNAVKCKYITLGSNSEGKERSTLGKYVDDDTDSPTVKPENVLKLSEIDFSKIASNVSKAGKMVEESENEFSGVKTYDIVVSADPSKTIHSFTIESRQGSKTTAKSGRLGAEISYLEFNFTADPEGNVKEKK